MKKPIPVTEAEIRKEISRREWNETMSTFRSLEEVLAMSPEELWKWWRDGTHAPVPLMAMYFAREPALIRQLIHSLPIEVLIRPYSALESIYVEVRDSIENYGLDEIWKDYIAQHMREE